MSELLFVAVSGPERAAMPLTPPGPHTIGRRQGHSLSLGAYEQVSRDHARLTHQAGSPAGAGAGAGTWLIADTNSRHGTFVNGVRLIPWKPCPLRAGDLVLIAPFAFRLQDDSAVASAPAGAAADSEPATMQAFGPADIPPEEVGALLRVEERSLARPQSVAQRRLALLLDCATAIHAAGDESAFAQAVVDAAVRGSGFPNAALLRHFGDGRVEILSALGCAMGQGRTPRISRSLLLEAAKGKPVRMSVSGGGSGALAEAISIVKLSIDEALCVPLTVGGAVVGFLYLDNRGADAMTIAATRQAAAMGGQAADDDAYDFALGLAGLASLALANLMRQDIERRHTMERQALFLGAVHSLVAAIDAKDPYTRGHSERVAHLSGSLAQAAGLDPESVEQVRVTGLVHDVGKIGVPEAVLRKPSRLTDEEFAQIKAHPGTGRRILQDIPQLAVGIGGVLHHHEKWSGGGYPDGLTGDRIPLFARIIGLADAFDAMSSSRAYRGALVRADVMAEITKCAGSHFDPSLVGHFAALDMKRYDEMVQALGADG